MIDASLTRFAVGTLGLLSINLKNFLKYYVPTTSKITVMNKKSRNNTVMLHVTLQMNYLSCKQNAHFRIRLEYFR